MNNLFPIRAAQAYLALQTEKIEYLRSYIDYIADHGYNTLFLYLAQRISCSAFSLGEGKGYRKEDLRFLVEYAAGKGIDVIPGLNLFGHADQILSLPEYEELAELRSGENGREHHNQKHVFCLSSAKVRKLIASFLEEVLEIFPSQYIHAGFDEALDVGYCEECRKKIRSFDDEQNLVLSHVSFIHDLLAAKGRRMMIWDDLLPLYPALTERMAKDIVICVWQYHQNVPEYCSYCFNATFRNALKEYREAGFDCIVCPADCSFVNSETFFSYGVREKALGAIVTAWPKLTFTPEQTRVTMGAAGLLLSGKASNMNDALAVTVKEVFGDMPEEFLAAVRYLRTAGYRFDEIQNASSLLRFPMYGPDESILSATLMALETLKKYRGKFPENSQQWRIFEELYCEAKCRELSLRSKKAAYRLLHGIGGEKLSEIVPELEEGFAGKEKVAKSIREESVTKVFAERKEQWKKTLLDLEKKLSAPHTLCRAVFCLPLTYGNTITGFYAVKDGKETFVGSGNFKIANGYEAYVSHFEWFFILPPDFAADQLKITAEGFTGTGVSFVHFLTPDGGEIVADSIKSVSGEVADPSFLLDKTDTFAYFGNQDGFHGAVDRKSSETVHTVVLNLKKV